MKKISLLLASALVFVACNKAGNISVEVANIPDGANVELQTIDLGAVEPKTISKAEVKEGKVVFENTFNDIDEAYIVFGSEEEPLGAVPFVGEKGDIKIFYDKDELTKIKVEGTEANDKLQELQSTMIPKINELKAFLNDNGLTLMMPVDENDEEAVKNRAAVEGKYETMVKELESFPAKFKEINKNTAIALLILSKEVPTKTKTAKEYQEEFDAFSIDLKSSLLGKKTQAAIKTLSESKTVVPTIGQKIGDFKGTTPTGEELSLYDYMQGKKLILIDVWAAWCGPCRAENPNIVKAYKLYHDKGFDIIGYSLDKTKEEWEAAIAKDGLTWTQVSNVAYWDDPIVSAYGIQGIPASYLIDGDGVVIATNLRGAALEEKVKEVLGL